MAPLQTMKWGALAVLLTGVSVPAQVVGATGIMSEFADILLPPVLASPAEQLEGARIRPPMLRTDRSEGAILAPRSGEAPAAIVRAPGPISNDRSDDRLPRTAMAFTAVPQTPPPSVTKIADEGSPVGGQGLSVLHLDEGWQKIGFVGGVCALAVALFWRLGLRARGRVLKPSYSPTKQLDVEDGAPMADGARYATLREAVEAMKAQATRR